MTDGTESEVESDVAPGVHDERSPWYDVREWSVRTWAWVAAVIGALIYLPSLWNGLVYDDVVIISDNERLRSWGALGELLLSPYWPVDQGSSLGLWRPTTSFVLFLTWQVGRGAVVAFHVVNVLLHAVVSGLVVRLAARVVSVAAAGLAGVIFAVHPVHVEAVANGVGLGELLAAALLLAALLVVVRDGPIGARRIVLACVLYALAFGAKEGAVVLPGLILVLDAVRGRLTLRDVGTWVRWRARLMAGLAGVAAVMLFCRSLILDGVASTMTPIGAELLVEIPRIWTLGEIWYQTLRVLAVPMWLSPDYSPELIPVLVGWSLRGVVGTAGVLTVLVLGWYAARRMRGVPRGAPRQTGDWALGLAAGVGWYIVAISPVANVLFLTGILLAERTLYLPSIGVAVAIAGLVSAPIFTHRPPRLVRIATLSIVGFLMLAWGTRTVTYIPAWRSNDDLFAYMRQSIPESLRAQFFIGDMLLQRGEEDLAMLHYQVALERVAPTHETLVLEAQGFIEKGHPDLAYLYLARARAWREDPTLTNTLLSVAARESGRFEAAEIWARRAVESGPDDGMAWYALGNALAVNEEWAEAADARRAEAALDSIPWQPWFAVAELSARAGDLEGARAAADSVRARTSDPAALEELTTMLIERGVEGGR